MRLITLDHLISQLVKARHDHAGSITAEIEVRGLGRWALASVEVEEPGPHEGGETVVTLYARPHDP